VNFEFRPQLIPTLAAIVAIAVMTKLGFWQYNKAQQKLALQAAYDARLHEPPVPLPMKIEDIEPWRYRHVASSGHYDARYQILLDNQVENETAGYHVITPFKPDSGGPAVLVDRGWIPMGDRAHLPEPSVPTEVVQISGAAWVPPSKFFELAPPPQSQGWAVLWQNLDIKRYAAKVPFSVLPFVVRLDANVDGGFMRNWPKPAERVETNIGYAWQWWGFAFTLACIWFYVNFRKRPA
jgi:surfeit locus 1 family protein